MTSKNPTSIQRFLLRMPHVGRQISDTGWQSIEALAARQLNEIQDLYNSDVVSLDGTDYHFTFDFQPCVEYYNDQYKRHKIFEETGDWSVWGYRSNDRADCFIECRVTRSTTEKNYDHTESILRFFIYEIFLVMCIVNPGVFNLDGADLVNVPEQRSVDGRPISYNLNVSANLPENYHYEAIKHPWMRQVDIGIDDARGWIKNAHPRFTMVGENPASRCLMAIINMCQGSSYSGASAAWAFNGLESLLDCRPGENRAALLRRITTILELNAAEAKGLRKVIGDLYDIRSAFVHGGLLTLHPVQDEVLDKRVDEESLRIMKAMDRGITLIISVLRMLVAKGMTWPVFEEKMRDKDTSGIA